MCAELCTGQEDKGVCVGAWGAWGTTCRLCRGSLCEERGHMASMRACGEGAAQMLGTHMGGTCLWGCPHPFVCRGQFLEEGGSSLGQPGIVVICWSQGCHRHQCGWGEAGHECLRALLTHGIIKGDKDKIWKMQRGNGSGQDSLSLLHPLCRHWWVLV